MWRKALEGGSPGKLPRGGDGKLWFWRVTEEQAFQAQGRTCAWRPDITRQVEATGNVWDDGMQSVKGSRNEKELAV